MKESIDRVLQLSMTKVDFWTNDTIHSKRKNTSLTSLKKIITTILCERVHFSILLISISRSVRISVSKQFSLLLKCGA